MPDRRSFLAAVTVGGVGVALTGGAAAQDAPATTPAPALSASAAPSPSPSPKPPSPAALAEATAMRAFDPRLTDAEVTEIARNIDDNTSSAARLNPKGRALANGDEPIVRFAAGEPLG